MIKSELSERWTQIAEKDWQLLHLGHIVRDLDKTLAFYESLGLISAVHQFPRERHDIQFTTHKTVATPPSPERSGPGKLKIVRMGPLPLEIIQIGEGALDPNGEFVDRVGDGISHIAFMVGDLEAETERMNSKGIEKLMTMVVDGQTTMHYFDTREGCGLMLELLQRNAWSQYLI